MDKKLESLIEEKVNEFEKDYDRDIDKIMDVFDFLATILDKEEIETRIVSAALINLYIYATFPPQINDKESLEVMRDIYIKFISKRFDAAIEAKVSNAR